MKLLDKDWKVVSLVAASIFVSLSMLYLSDIGLVSYDMYNHMAFAKHYAKNWFSTTIPWLGGGLDISSYPPLVFQLMALLTYLPFVPLIGAYILLTSIFTALLGYSVALFTGEWLDYPISRNAVLIGVAFSPAVLKAVVAFGQLTTLVGLTFGFLSLFLLNRYLEKGGKETLLLLSLSTALTAFSHHLSALLTLIGLIGVAILNIRSFTAEKAKPLLVAAISTLTLTVVGLLPALREFLGGEVVHETIPHLSRHPFKTSKATDLFLTSSYGPAIIGFLYPLLRRGEQELKLYLLALFFAILGLGMATPLPEILFGGLASWLTYDRFTLVSALLFTAFLSVHARKNISRKHFLILITALYILGSFLLAFHAHSLVFGKPFQGVHTDEERQATLEFLNQNASSEYRYQTFGYGAPIGDIYFYTGVPTLDTIYFSGRKIPWIKRSGIAEIDQADRGFFRNFMSHTDNYSVKYVFTYEKRYRDWMNRSSWTPESLAEGVTLWTKTEEPEAVKKVETEKNVWFGIIPPATLIMLILSLWNLKGRKETPIGIGET
ncbi:MAG: hypothetical protein ABEJ83_02210 [Candidatus Nanohaloarchaea archaeon]